ncbi:DegT/DnrJ/EryC1/StrS family aminotransferase [Candidatus Woesearchaeota archaeon]|nr:DegT/DnrJ/EryC1/StrS family aminotransferase [Candidatus Woesearchaeota archaeon]
MDQRVADKLREYTRHQHVKIVNCGNAAIFTSLWIAKKVNPKPFILIPDQGGWISYKNYPKILTFEIKEIKTNYGLIDLVDLEKEAKTGAAFIMPSFAGYFAEQNLALISSICRKHNCLLIEDATASISDETLCNGEFSDIIIGSFGSDKPVNVGHGGVISVKEGEWFEKASDVLSMFKANLDYKDLYERLVKVKKRLKFFYETQQKIKKELQDFNVLHKDKRGINVVVKYKDSGEKEKLIDYCKKNNYEYVMCPKYYKVEEEAISIEVKRLNPKL